MAKNKQKGNVVIGVLLTGLLIWGIASFFGSNEEDYNSYEEPYRDYKNYSEDEYSYDEDYIIEEDEPLYYNGYECTDDCSGHEAGYNWAEENGIYDSNDCGGNSDSFIEGCMSYAEENW